MTVRARKRVVGRVDAVVATAAARDELGVRVAGLAERVLGADPAADLDAGIGSGNVEEPGSVDAANLHVFYWLGRTARAVAGRSTCSSGANSRRSLSPDGRAASPLFGLMSPAEDRRRSVERRFARRRHRGEASRPAARCAIRRPRAVPHPCNCDGAAHEIARSEAAEDACSDRAGGRATRDEANHSGTDSRAFDRELRLRARFRERPVKKIFACEELSTCERARIASRGEKIAVQECRAFANRSSEVKKTLEPCGFLHCRRNPPVARKISCATRADATRCIVIT